MSELAEILNKLESLCESQNRIEESVREILSRMNSSAPILQSWSLINDSDRDGLAGGGISISPGAPYSERQGDGKNDLRNLPHES